jgi:hypothetical protein
MKLTTKITQVTNREAARMGVGGWWVSPEGQVIAIDEEHSSYFREHPEVFGLTPEEVDLVQNGSYLDRRQIMQKVQQTWIRINKWQRDVGIIIPRLSNKYLDQAQTALMSGDIRAERVSIVDQTEAGMTANYDDFLKANSIGDLKRRAVGVREATKKCPTPDPDSNNQ